MIQGASKLLVDPTGRLQDSVLVEHEQDGIAAFVGVAYRATDNKAVTKGSCHFNAVYPPYLST